MTCVTSSTAGRPSAREMMKAALAVAVADSRRKAAPTLVGLSLDRYQEKTEAAPPVVVASRRRGPSRRMVQQRRAAHARARWPWKLQTQWAWTDAEACLIDVLLYLGGSSGCFDAYRSELENRAGIRPSTQRAVEAKLRASGLLEVTENRLGYARNEANSYRLKGILREASRMLWAQRGEGTKVSAPSGGVENQQHHTSPSLAPEKSINRTPGRRPPVALRAPTSPQSGEVSMSLGRTEVAKPPEPDAATPGVDEGLALDLARTFLPDIAPDEPSPETAAELMAIADRLQRTYAPTLWPQVWRTWRARFGLTAALAVLETGVMRRGGKIRESGAQYLSGILGRNRRQAPAPEATLQAIRTSRRASGLARSTRWPTADGRNWP
jgi:hypothetical protein